jgi:hypothetical protein
VAKEETQLGKSFERRNLTWQDGFSHPKKIKGAGGTATIVAHF